LKGAKLALNWMRLSDAKNGFWRGDRLCKSVCRTRYSKWSKEFPEQDGLILRVIEESGRASAWPYLSRFAGYCLTGLTSKQAWFMFYGGTASGKFTLINVLRGLLGPYALALPENYFLSRKIPVTSQRPPLPACGSQRASRRTNGSKGRQSSTHPHVAIYLQEQRSEARSRQRKNRLPTHRPSRSDWLGTGRCSFPFPLARRAMTLGVWTHRRRYKWIQRQHGNGVADSLPSGSGNLDVQLRRQRSSNLSRRRMQSHANPSLPKFPANREKTGKGTLSIGALRR
jgi:hypothetical protein